MRILVAVTIAAGLAACGEIPQDAPKPYAGKEDTKAYAGDAFKDDQALAKRANYQNEYARASWIEKK